jgi:thymidylate kinase
MAIDFFVGRKIETERIFNELKKVHNDKSLKSIIALHGLAGAGKTTLLNKVEEKVKAENLTFVSFRINEDIKFKYITEFANELSKTFFSNIKNTKNSFNKVQQENTHFLKIAGEIESVFSDEEKAGLNRLKNEIVKADREKGKGKFTLPGIKLGKIQINLGEIEGKELSGKETAEFLRIERDKERDRIVSERYKNEEDQTYFKNPMLRITKAFLDDLYDSIYPGKFFGGCHNSDKKPIKIIFIIDTYEKISDFISDWLLECFIPEIFKKHNDFDARFIISGREDLKLSDFYRRWDRYSDILIQYDIHRFTKDETKEYLQKREVDLVELNNAYNDTEGLAYLLYIWVNTRGKGDAQIWRDAANRIFWWKTEEQKEWIKSASFLDYFDEDNLSIFLGDKTATIAFEWLKECYEITRSSPTSDGKFQLHSTVRKVIKNAIKQQSDEKYNEYKKRRDIFEEINKQFPNKDTREKLIKCSYFINFDQLALENVDLFDSFILFGFAANNPKWFIKQQYTYHMADEIRELLSKYEQYKQKEHFFEIKNKIKKAWEIRKNEINLRIDTKENEKVAEIHDKQILSNEAERLKVEIQEKGKLIKEKQHLSEQFYDKEINESVTEHHKKQHITPFIFICIGVILFLNGLFINNNFRVLILSFGGIFIILGFVKLLMHKKAKIIKKETIKPISESDRIKRDLEQQHNDLDNLKFKLNQTQNNIEKYTLEIQECQKNIDKYKQILNEPWI